MEDYTVEYSGKVPNTKLTDWESEPTYDDLHRDYTEASTTQEKIRADIQEWRLYDEGGPKVKPARKGASTVRPRLIKKQKEWQIPALEDPLLAMEDMYTVNPRSAEDKLGARQNELVLNWQMNTQLGKLALVSNSIRTLVDDGTVVAKVGWNAEYETQTVVEERPVYATAEQALQLMREAVMRGKMTAEEAEARLQMGEPMQIGTEQVEVDKEVLVKNHPTVEVCNIENVIIDPTCEGVLSKAEFIIYEYPMAYGDLEINEHREEVDEETGKKTTYGLYHNLKKIKNEDFIAVDTDSEGLNDFSFTDRPRKKVRVYEYWGYWDINGNGNREMIVASWVGGVLIRLEKSPYPHKKLPFAVAQYTPKKLEIMGEPMTELLAEHQDIVGKMTRASLDITGTQAAGQMLYSDQFFSTKVDENNFNSGLSAKYRVGMDPRQGIFQRSVEPVPQSVFQMIDIHQREAESLSGTIAFNSGISGQSLGSTAAGVNASMSSSGKRELSILRRLSAYFVDIAELIIPMNQAFLSEETVIRVTNEEFVTVRRDDLKGEYDLKIDISTPARDNETAEKLNTLLQTVGPSNPEMFKIIGAEIARLWKRPKLAEDIETFKPQPDPKQQELVQLQIDYQKMINANLVKDLEDKDSKINERVSRYTENLQSDIAMKKAKAEQALAAAEKLRSEADEIDRQFIDKQTGVEDERKAFQDEAKHARDMEKEQMKHEIELLKAQLNQKTGETR